PERRESGNMRCKGWEPAFPRRASGEGAGGASGDVQTSQSVPSRPPVQSRSENARAFSPFSLRNLCKDTREVTSGARVRYQCASASSSGVRARALALLSREARDSSTLRLESRKGKGAPAPSRITPSRQNSSAHSSGATDS